MQGLPNDRLGGVEFSTFSTLGKRPKANQPERHYHPNTAKHKRNLRLPGYRGNQHPLPIKKEFTEPQSTHYQDEGSISTCSPHNIPVLSRRTPS